MNHQDLEILSYIKNNCRNSITEMSREVGLSTIELLDKIKVYEKNYIKNYTCVLNFQKVGFKFDSYIIIKIENGLKRNFEKLISKNKNVNSFFKLSEGEYLIEALFRNENKFNKFLEKIKEKFEISDLKILKVNQEFKRESLLEC